MRMRPTFSTTVADNGRRSTCACTGGSWPLGRRGSPCRDAEDRRNHPHSPQDASAAQSLEVRRRPHQDPRRQLDRHRGQQLPAHDPLAVSPPSGSRSRRRPDARTAAVVDRTLRSACRVGDPVEHDASRHRLDQLVDHVDRPVLAGPGARLVEPQGSVEDDVAGVDGPETAPIAFGPRSPLAAVTPNAAPHMVRARSGCRSSTCVDRYAP